MTRRQRLRLLMVLVAWVLCGLRNAASETGQITGTVDSPRLVTAIHAIDRQTDKQYAGKLDAGTGRFTISGLPVGRHYDCRIDVVGGRLEGVNLKVKRSDYEEEQPLTAQDIESIKETTRSLNKFEDRIDILAVDGNIQHAVVLVNKLRLRPFVNSKPREIVWRLELWHFERPEETWIKEQEELFLVLYRERIQKGDYERKALMLDPALGGVELNRDHPVVALGTIKISTPAPGVRLRPKASKDNRAGHGVGTKGEQP